jgi:hypothetical protein
MIFVQLLLTSFVMSFLAAWESDFLSHFLIHLALKGSMSYVRPNDSGAERMVFSKQDACGNLVVDSVPVFFPISAFCQRFLVQMSIGQLHIIPFYLT